MTDAMKALGHTINLTGWINYLMISTRRVSTLGGGEGVGG